MTRVTFPTNFAAKGHFGRGIEDVIDISVETRENRYLIHQLSAARMSFDLLAKIEVEEAEGGGSLPKEWEALRNNLSDIAPIFPMCSHCGQMVKADNRGDTFVPLFECSEPGGMKPYDVVLDIPSGKIVFANDLRSLVVIEDTADVNTVFGQRMRTKAATAAGMVMVFTGNTCPSVVRSGEEIHVGISLPKKGRLGTVVTDLWWYSAMDHDFFLSRCEAEGETPQSFSYFVVDVDPGVYAFSDELANTHANTAVLSKIRKTDAPRPVLSTDGLDTATSLKDSRFWKLVESRLSFSRGGISLLGDIFCVAGGGLDWINGGLRSVSGRDDDPAYGDKLEERKGTRSDDRIPMFSTVEVGVIYPMSWNSPGRLGVAPIDIDPYCLAAGMMFVKTALVCPMKIVGESRMSEEQKKKELEKNRAVFVASLDLLCEIAEVRGLWDSGRLETMFAELVQAFAEKG
jgi:hypothetical protein